MVKRQSVAEKLKLKEKLVGIMQLVQEVRDSRNSSGEITPDVALTLHVKIWLGRTTLTDMLAVAKSYELNKKIERDNALIDIGSQAETTKINAKEHFAKSDDQWRQLQQDAKDAEVFREYLENKRHDLEQAVFVTKNLVEYGRKDAATTPNREI